jgi:hypothetical protein
VPDPTTPPSAAKPIISLEHSVVQSPKF